MKLIDEIIWMFCCYVFICIFLVCVCVCVCVLLSMRSRFSAVSWVNVAVVVDVVVVPAAVMWNILSPFV